LLGASTTTSMSSTTPQSGSDDRRCGSFDRPRKRTARGCGSRSLSRRERARVREPARRARGRGAAAPPSPALRATSPCGRGEPHLASGDEISATSGGELQRALSQSVRTGRVDWRNCGGGGKSPFEAALPSSRWHVGHAVCARAQCAR
jgi:hypothetical protein